MGQCGLRSCDEPEVSDLKEVSAPRTLRLAILRHGERADQANPKMWFKSMLGRRYPFDPPLTLAGAKQAKSVGKEISFRDDIDAFICRKCYKTHQGHSSQLLHMA